MVSSQIDTKRFTEVAEEMRAALEGDLFTVVTSDDSGVGKLKECFGGVQNLLEAAGQLLGWPQSMRERSVWVVIPAKQTRLCPVHLLAGALVRLFRTVDRWPTMKSAENRSLLKTIVCSV